jgi:hypothetical protein
LVLAGAFDWMGQVIRPVTPLALLYFVSTRFSPWTRFFAPYLGAALLLVILASLLVGAVRARRGNVYLAKSIDLASGLEDRLSSAVEWSSLATLDPFQKRCIEQLAMQVGARQWKLVIPPMEVAQWQWTAASALVLALLPAAYLRRPPAMMESNAREKVVMARPVLKAATDQALALGNDSVTLHDPEVEDLSKDLSAFIREIDHGAMNREASLDQLERLRQKMTKLQGRYGGRRPALDAGGDAGPVGALARAILKGSSPGVVEALTAIASALKAGTLGEEESNDLQPMLEALAELTSDADAGAAKLLKDAARHLAARDAVAAAGELAMLKSHAAVFAQPLKRQAALNDAERTLRTLSQALTGAAADNPKQAGAGAGAGKEAQPREVTSDSSASGEAATAGEQAGGDRFSSGKTPSPLGTNELAVKGVWKGRVMRQLFESPDGKAQSDEVKNLLIEHDRVAEERFRRDEIPPEYQDAVRAYFSALHRKGR